MFVSYPILLGVLCQYTLESIFKAMTPVVLNLRYWRERRGLTQAELAETIGARQATISGFETGKTQRIEFDLLQRLANALRCKPKDLIGEKGK